MKIDLLNGGGGNNMRRLNTIQKFENLNYIYSISETGPGGAYHEYAVIDSKNAEVMQNIFFQKGPRKDPNSVNGVLDCDLLEIVRDRLIAFNKGTMSCVENEKALYHLEEALMWMNRRVEDRIARQVLGTMQQ